MGPQISVCTRSLGCVARCAVILGIGERVCFERMHGSQVQCSPSALMPCFLSVSLILLKLACPRCMCHVSSVCSSATAATLAISSWVGTTSPIRKIKREHLENDKTTLFDSSNS